MKYLRGFEDARNWFKDPILFWTVFLIGTAISFLVTVNQKTFNDFLLLFAAGLTISLTAAGLWTNIDNRHLRVAAVSIVVISGIFVVFLSQGSLGCLGWGAYEAQHPVTGKCHAFGGCGPEYPWYYQDTCTAESRERMCERLENSNKENADQFHHQLCTDYPDLNTTMLDHSLEDETLTLMITENQFNYSDAKKLRIEPQNGEEFRIERNNTTYNTSNLIAKNETSIFNNSMRHGDIFTIVYDGTDLDGDGRKGADFEDLQNFGEMERRTYLTYRLKWWNSNEKNGTRLGHITIYKNGDLRYSQVF